MSIRTLRRWRRLYVAIALLLTACGGAGTTPAVPPAPTSTLMPAPTQGPIITIVILGETARSEAEEITVHAFRHSSIEGGEAATDGHEWLLLDVEVRNLTEAPLPFSVRHFRAGGHESERAYPPGVGPALDKAIAGGDSLRGEVAFLVALGTPPGSVVFGLGVPSWAVQLANIPAQ